MAKQKDAGGASDTGSDVLSAIIPEGTVRTVTLSVRVSADAPELEKTLELDYSGMRVSDLVDILCQSNSPRVAWQGRFRADPASYAGNRVRVRVTDLYGRHARRPRPMSPEELADYIGRLPEDQRRRYLEALSR